MSSVNTIRKWSGLEGNEINKTERQILCDLTYMWNLKQTNELNSHRKRDQNCGYQNCRK